MPNTCHDCGLERKHPDGSYIYYTEVYAPNADAAKAGQGLCPVCAGVADEGSPEANEGMVAQPVVAQPAPAQPVVVATPPSAPTIPPVAENVEVKEPVIKDADALIKKNK